VPGFACELSRVHTTLPCSSRELEWHFGHSSEWLGTECAARPRRAARQRVGKHSHPVGHDALSACAAKKWLSGRVPPERFCQR